nr:zinc ribbon domain-containing protein [Saccharofermentans sp.]
PYCGAEIDADSNFCLKCGSKLNSETASVSQENAATDPVSQPAASYEEIKISEPVKVKKPGGGAAFGWSKFFAVSGILLNLLAFSYLSRTRALHYFFEDLYYYIAFALMICTIVFCVMACIKAKRKSLKYMVFLPAVMGVIAVFGGIYGIRFEFYYHAIAPILLAVAGTVLSGLASLFMAAAMIKGKNLFNALSIFATVFSIIAFYFFFGCCFISKTTYGEMYFLLGLADVAGVAIVSLLLQSAYNSEVRFDSEEAEQYE